MRCSKRSLYSITSSALAARYDEASSWAEKAVREQANYASGMRMAAASHALAGRLEEAQKVMARLRQIIPKLRVSNLKSVMSFQRPEDFTRYAEGLQKAGLPDRRQNCLALRFGCQLL